MEQSLFRKESVERVSSPEQLSDILHVTSPAVWVVLAAVILSLVSLFVWSGVTSVECYATGRGEVSGGVLTITFDDADKAENVEAGMDVKAGGKEALVSSVRYDENGRLMAAADVDLPDGSYDARVGYKRMQIIELLFS